MKRNVFLALTCVIAGCNSGPDMPDTVDVSGVVTIDGQPVEGVEVNFVSEKEQFAGYGKTDSQGRYRLVSGAVPGENKVHLSKIEGGEIVLDPEGGMDEGQLEAMMQAAGEQGGPKVPKQLIPKDYSDPANTKLKFPVPERGTDKADFKL